MVVSSALLIHDVSARAHDVSIGIALFPIGRIQCSVNEYEGDLPQAHVITCQHVSSKTNGMQLANVMKIAAARQALLKTAFYVTNNKINYFLQSSQNDGDI